jgi:hypothetical protein
MFNSRALQFTTQTTYLRNARIDATAFAAPEVRYSFSVSCKAAIMFTNVFATMKVSMCVIHGKRACFVQKINITGVVKMLITELTLLSYDAKIMSLKNQDKVRARVKTLISRRDKRVNMRFCT